MEFTGIECAHISAHVISQWCCHNNSASASWSSSFKLQVHRHEVIIGCQSSLFSGVNRKSVPGSVFSKKRCFQFNNTVCKAQIMRNWILLTTRSLREIHKPGKWVHTVPPRWRRSSNTLANIFPQGKLCLFLYGTSPHLQGRASLLSLNSWAVILPLFCTRYCQSDHFFWQV